MVILFDYLDTFLSAVKLRDSDEVIWIIGVVGVSLGCFTGQGPGSTEHMDHHHTIGEDVNLVYVWIDYCTCTCRFSLSLSLSLPPSPFSLPYTHTCTCTASKTLREG